MFWWFWQCFRRGQTRVQFPKVNSFRDLPIKWYLSLEITTKRNIKESNLNGSFLDDAFDWYSKGRVGRYVCMSLINIQGWGRGVSHRFREGATCTCSAESLIKGVLSKPVAHSASLTLSSQTSNNSITLSVVFFFRER